MTMDIFDWLDTPELQCAFCSRASFLRNPQTNHHSLYWYSSISPVRTAKFIPQSDDLQTSVFSSCFFFCLGLDYRSNEVGLLL